LAHWLNSRMSNPVLSEVTGYILYKGIRVHRIHSGVA